MRRGENLSNNITTGFIRRSICSIALLVFFLCVQCPFILQLFLSSALFICLVALPMLYLYRQRTDLSIGIFHCLFLLFFLYFSLIHQYIVSFIVLVFPYSSPPLFFFVAFCLRHFFFFFPLFIVQSKSLLLSEHHIHPSVA